MKATAIALLSLLVSTDADSSYIARRQTKDKKVKGTKDTKNRVKYNRTTKKDKWNTKKDKWDRWSRGDGNKYGSHWNDSQMGKTRKHTRYDSDCVISACLSGASMGGYWSPSHGWGYDPHGYGEVTMTFAMHSSYWWGNTMSDTKAMIEWDIKGLDPFANAADGTQYYLGIFNGATCDLDLLDLAADPIELKVYAGDHWKPQSSGVAMGIEHSFDNGETCYDNMGYSVIIFNSPDGEGDPEAFACGVLHEGDQSCHPYYDDDDWSSGGDEDDWHGYDRKHKTAKSGKSSKGYWDDQHNGDHKNDDWNSWVDDDDDWHGSYRRHKIAKSAKSSKGYWDDDKGSHEDDDWKSWGNDDWKSWGNDDWKSWGNDDWKSWGNDDWKSWGNDDWKSWGGDDGYSWNDYHKGELKKDDWNSWGRDKDWHGSHEKYKSSKSAKASKGYWNGGHEDNDWKSWSGRDDWSHWGVDSWGYDGRGKMTSHHKHNRGGGGWYWG